MPPRPGERHAWIDIAKSFAIYLVILGHLDQSDFVSSFLWTFHVPLFFFISGFLSRPRDPPATVRHLLRRLAGPYVYLYVANVAITVLQAGDHDPAAILRMLLGILYGTHSYPFFVNAQLWFLPALITVEAVYQLLVRRVPLAYIPLLMLSYAIYRRGEINLPFSFDLALLGLNFFLAGVLARRLDLARRLQALRAGPPLLGGACLLGTLAAAAVGNVWYTGPHYVVSFGAGIVGIVMTVAAAMTVAPLLERAPVVRRMIAFVSANTLFILCFNQYTTRYADVLLAPVPLDPWLAKSAVIALLAIVLLVPFNLLVLRFVPALIGVEKPSRPT